MGMNFIIKGADFSANKIGVVNYNVFVEAYLQALDNSVTDVEKTAVRKLATTLINKKLFGKIDAIYPILGNTEDSISLNMRSSKYKISFDNTKVTGGSVVFAEKGFYIDNPNSTSNPNGVLPGETFYRQSDKNLFLLTHVGTKIKNYSNPITMGSILGGTALKLELGSCIFLNTYNSLGQGTQAGICVNVSTGAKCIDTTHKNEEGTYLINRLGDDSSLWINTIKEGTKNGLSDTDLDLSLNQYTFAIGGYHGSFPFLCNNPIKFAAIGGGLTDAEITNLNSAVNTFLVETGKKV